MSFSDKSPQSVLIFDVNETLLDLATLKESVAEILNGNEETVSLWFEKLLHYSLVDSARDQYHNFGEIGAAALVMLAEERNMDMDMPQAREILQPIRSAPPHPDVVDALDKLKARGYRMAVLTNSPRDTMEAQLSNAGIDSFFEQRFSVEDLGLYKPHQRVYRWGADQMNIQPVDCLFVAAHGWDVAGAMTAGMQAAFIARPGQQKYALAPEPNIIAANMQELAQSLS